MDPAADEISVAGLSDIVERWFSVGLVRWE